MTAIVSHSRPELLAPAGDWDCLRAAVENGADAVYFGLQTGFNARARAHNFELTDLPEVMAYLHQRGVKGYLTLNTLVFTSELPAFESVLTSAARAGVDAVLLQDLGAVRLAKAVCPKMAIHASTQMTLTSGECIALAAELGIDRVVLAREMSLEEIRDIQSQSTVPLEAFVHGALCVAYSGQCLTSESLGGRSANRGQCAQACRLPYDLVCDGQDVDLGAVKYLLSPQDLAAYELTPDLIAAGVISFKIEGRLKTPEYVANTVQHYRRAIDAAVLGQPVTFSTAEVRNLELSFSRGFSPGWLEGNNHKRLVPGDSSSKRGVLIGDVVRTTESTVLVRLCGPVAPGDGVVFEGDRAAGTEQGGRVYGVSQFGRPIPPGVETGVVELAFQHGGLDLAALTFGQKLFKTDDPGLTNRLRATYTSADPLRKVPIAFHVRAIAGEALVVEAVSLFAPKVTISSGEPLPVARKQPATLALLQTELARLGHTVYELSTVTAEIVGEPMIPLSMLSAVRRELITALDAAHRAPAPRQIASEPVLPRLRFAAAQRTSPTRPAQLRVLCRSLTQLEAALPLRLDGIYCDFADIREYRQAVEMAAGSGTPILLATPRIQKPGEMGIFRAIEKQGAVGILVRNLSGLRYFTQSSPDASGTKPEVVADYSLNATNELTTDYLLGEGAARVTPSYDLNRDQLGELVAATPAGLLEVVVHQRMPMFHMEHCVFCAVLSPGTNKTNCGRPCDTHVVELRDRVGQLHPLTADVGCRNTLFNASPQSSAEIFSMLREQGVQNFRVEFLTEPEAEIRRTVLLYRQLLAGEVSGAEVWKSLRAMNRVGITRGTLEERRNPLAIL